MGRGRRADALVNTIGPQSTSSRDVARINTIHGVDPCHQLNKHIISPVGQPRNPDAGGEQTALSIHRWSSSGPQHEESQLLDLQILPGGYCQAKLGAPTAVALRAGVLTSAFCSPRVTSKHGAGSTEADDARTSIVGRLFTRAAGAAVGPGAAHWAAREAAGSGGFAGACMRTVTSSLCDLAPARGGADWV